MTERLTILLSFRLHRGRLSLPHGMALALLNGVVGWVSELSPFDTEAAFSLTSF